MTEPNPGGGALGNEDCDDCRPDALCWFHETLADGLVKANALDELIGSDWRSAK